MSTDIRFRKLKASEIDCRVSTINKSGCSLLLYKDARVDQNILDETFGIFGWNREHMLIGDNLYCRVGVKNPDTGEWVYKQDVGTESYTEKEKGQASDSFKRACFNLGIGRELYTAPFIWIKSGAVKIEQGDNGKYTTKDRFCVAEIGYDDVGNINHLVILNEKTNEDVFIFNGDKVTNARNEKAEEEKRISEEGVKGILLKLSEVGMTADEVCKKFKIKELSEISVDQYRLLLKDINDKIEGKK